MRFTGETGRDLGAVNGLLLVSKGWVDLERLEEWCLEGDAVKMEGVSGVLGVERERWVGVLGWVIAV